MDPRGELKLSSRRCLQSQSAELGRSRLAISDSTAQRFTAQDPDVRLMLQVRDDDADAFEELMKRYQNRLVSLMSYQVGRRDLAEDLAQDVFLRVYRARKRYMCPAPSFPLGSTRLLTTWH